MTTFAAFDNTRTVRDDAGDHIRYLTDPLAETYIEPPGAWISEGMLPPEDLEVRRALAEMKALTDHAKSFGFLSRLFGSDTYRKARTAAVEKQQALLSLVNSSREHKAAIRRIVNAMPLGNGGREALLLYTN